MREVIKLSTPKEPAFLKANQDGGAIPSQAHKDGLRGGELSHLFHVILGLSSVEVRGGFPIPPIVLEEIEARPSHLVLSLNQFGRGQQVSSVQCSSFSTGWKPKPIPIQWRLLGGAGEKPRRKVGPTTKAQDGNYFYVKFLYVQSGPNNS